MVGKRAGTVDTTANSASGSLVVQGHHATNLARPRSSTRLPGEGRRDLATGVSRVIRAARSAAPAPRPTIRKLELGLQFAAVFTDEFSLLQDDARNLPRLHGFEQRTARKRHHLIVGRDLERAGVRSNDRARAYDSFVVRRWKDRGPLSTETFLGPRPFVCLAAVGGLHTPSRWPVP